MPAELTARSIEDLYAGSAAPYLPSRRSRAALARGVQDCRGCPLLEHASQGVMGEGRRGSRIMLVGEQPGDREDIEGRPFVGPAGRLLDRALEEAGIGRAEAYVTNAVKHFKWEARGKRRIHQRPTRGEVDACGPWLASEIEYVRPDFLVLLGSTAAQAVLGASVRVTQIHGEVFEDTPLARRVMATVHPSSILRSLSDEERRLALEAFVEDLRGAVE